MLLLIGASLLILFLGQVTAQSTAPLFIKIKLRTLRGFPLN